MKTREWIHAAAMAGVLLFLGKTGCTPEFCHGNLGKRDCLWVAARGKCCSVNETTLGEFDCIFIFITII